jgi:poly-gamma-glutamate synthesis protein (capsule biosynthesis protein)
MHKYLLTVLILLLVFISSCQVDQATPSPTLVVPTLRDKPAQNPSPTIQQNKPGAEVTPTKTVAPSSTPLPSPTPSRQVILMAVGDIMLGRTIGDLILTEGPEAPFLFTAETFRTADITLGNLECPISIRGTPVEKNYTFRAPIEAGQALSIGGFDIVNLANNHVFDYGQIAFEDTLKVLMENDILFVGAGRNASEAYAPLNIEVNGLKLAILAFVDVPTQDFDYLSWEAKDALPGVAWAHPEKIQQSVKEAKLSADFVIVLLHNGYEFAQRVSGAQQDIAHLAIDSGASLVIGSHPHVLQRLEEYQGGLIAYSMGNFVFDNFLFPPNYSAILKVEISPNGIEAYEMIDVVVQLNGVPQIMPYDLDGEE